MDKTVMDELGNVLKMTIIVDDSDEEEESSLGQFGQFTRAHSQNCGESCTWFLLTFDFKFFTYLFISFMNQI